MLIAVDGPSGAGKGTLARRLAQHYHLAFLDTGLIYRAVGAQMLAQGISLDDEQKAVQIAQNMTLDALTQSNLRTDETAQAASIIGVYPAVRQALLAFQQDFAAAPPAGYCGAVLDGRDIGTRICPNADYKFYITADVKIRAERRCKELQERNIPSIYSDVLNDMMQRDQRDQQRSACPLRPADDAIVIDTTHFTAEEAFNFAVNCIEHNAKEQKSL